MSLKTKCFNCVRIILIVAISINLSACSVLTPSKQKITITSNVPDANITVNGENMGVGNLSYSVPRNQNVSIMAVKEGYQPSFKTVSRRYNVGGILDLVVCWAGLIILTFPWCVSGIAAPGAWDLDETNILIHMVPDNSYKAESRTEQLVNPQSQIEEPQNQLEESQNENPAI